MKETAIAYLMKNPLLHMDMIEPIHRSTAVILYAGCDGVLLKEQKSRAFMISAASFDKGKELADMLPSCNLAVAHQRVMADYIMEKFALTEKMDCVQAVYTGESKLVVDRELEIRKLELAQRNVVIENYDTLSAAEITHLLAIGNVYGGYKNGNLIGFVGEHLEGSIGLLEVFPKYRRLGYGTALESFMVNNMLAKGFVPFGQVEASNVKSITLQKKLGFAISKEHLYWLFS
ncbi:GNAT family N-acetyltransferase [Bacillaceae bacterium Marseille-Q3522]|nr:GNAT family N-acetyltransferase [Bacillaceae bacterium Marseille-Q3522]